jgi:predicted phage terminase large subunit-like protein
MSSSRSSPSLLEKLARQRLTELRAGRARTAAVERLDPGALDLLDFIPAVRANYERPEHLAQILDVFSRTEHSAVKALISAPPQHAKTTTVMMGCAWRLKRNPALSIGYASYSDNIARTKSREARDYAIAAGVELRDDSSAASEWLTTGGGGMHARGIGGGFTSLGMQLLVVDDPHKDRAEAESALARQRVYDWFVSVADTRVHPGGSKIIFHTRWHPDDLIGRLAAEGGWEVYNLPAITETGAPLWHRRPLDFLAERRRQSEYDWWSLWMGAPRPRGGEVFKGVKFYDELPKRFRIGKGLDLAYSAKTRADFSSSVVLVEHDDLYYVVDVRRAHEEVPAFARSLRAADLSWPGRWHWFCSTTERGLAHLLTDEGVKVDDEQASQDKFLRAQPVSVAWNEGRVLVPRDAPWLKDFVEEVTSFTGVTDRHDDQVDALASAFESLRWMPAPRATSGGFETQNPETRPIG